MKTIFLFRIHAVIRVGASYLTTQHRSTPVWIRTAVHTSADRPA